MKKVFSLLATAAFAFAFVACEDVPAPYEIYYEDNTDNGTAADEVKTLPYMEAFATSLGSFENVTTSGGGEWINDYSTAKASGYDNATQVTTAGTYYLVSPQISLADITEAYISYEYILRYNRGDENQRVLISADYTDNPTTATWTTLAQKHTEGVDWATFETGKVNIPSEFLGKTIRIAFYYNTNATSGSTWEVKNFAIQQGKVDEGESPSTSTDLINESFSSGLGVFKAVNVEGNYSWYVDYSCVQVTSYADADGDGVKEDNPAESWLVSSPVDMSNVESAHIVFDYILRYVNESELETHYQLLISKDYDGTNVSSANWTSLGLKPVQGSDWKTWYSSGKLNVPAEFCKVKNVTVAFRYKSTTKAGTWEVKNFKMIPGAGEESDEGEEDVPSTELGGLETFANGDFEAWSGGKPTHWTPTTTAGNGTLSQSTDAHSGSYSVKVTGATSGNKRIAYKEMILEAGSYTMSFYVKAATASGGSVRPGYVPVTDGKVGQYVYGDYVNDLSDAEWTLVTHKFELSAQATVNLVIMNSKNPGKDVLIDDFTIVKE